MPAIANIVVADATPVTPVDHTFEPLSASVAMSTWQEHSATTFEGNGRIAIVMSPPTSTRKTSRIKGTVTLPVERLNSDGIAEVTDIRLYTLEGVVPSRCSDQEALDGFTIAMGAFQDALIAGYYTARKTVY